MPTRNSVCVLPNTEQCCEDFEWLQTEIIALGGAATVFTADAISEGGAEDIVTVFQETRTRNYGAPQKDIKRLLTAARRKRQSADEQRATRAVRALRDRFDALERIDFFGATARDETASALAELERRVHGPSRDEAAGGGAKKASDFERRRWVTRRRPGVDRMASAWLIRRYIDPKAVFAFVDKPADTDVPFDMYAGGFGHRGGLCTSEVLCDEFGLVSVPVWQIARIVHDLDLKEATYAMQEAPVVGRMVEGLRALHADDAALLEQGIAMFDALARSFEVK